MLRCTITFSIMLLCLFYSSVEADGFNKYCDIDYNLDMIAPSQANSNSLDIYVPKSGVSNMPVMVYVHGGAWCIGDKGRIHYKADLFTSHGYVFISINYRLSPYPFQLDNPKRLRFPSHPQDVGEALAWIYRNIRKYNGNRNKIFLIGHSAGAHLVALVGTNPSYVARYNAPFKMIKGICTLDGAAYDIPSYLNAAAKNFHYNAFGTLDENRQDQSWTKASPAYYANSEDAPFLLITQEDEPLRITQNQILAQRLSWARILVYNKTHGEINLDLGNPNDSSGMTEAVVHFFNTLAFH